MKQLVRVIKTQRDYDAAVARLSSLMDKEIRSGSAEEDELELLTLVISSYERTRVPPVAPDPIDAITFRMDQQALSKKDLEPFIGSPSKVSEVLSRKRPLSLAMIRRLHKGLGIPADVLIGESNDDIDLATDAPIDYAKFPLSEMHAREMFPDFKGGAKQLKEYAEELMRSFFRGFGDAKNHAFLRAPLHQSGARMMDESALCVWRLCVIKKARSVSLATKYKETTITDGWLRDLAKLSSFEHGPHLAQEYLRNHGIPLIIERHFKRTYLDGAAMLDGEQPVVALTLRHDRIDNFWFALLHECMHVRKHLKPNHAFIADNLDDKTRSSNEEQEADAGAEEALIPDEFWKGSAVRQTHSLNDALKLALELRIHPAIVAGRVRKETGDWRLLSGLISSAGKVEPLFREQLEH
jgi:HTH-type transcriptional regulator/antitoxin HigA